MNAKLGCGQITWLSIGDEVMDDIRTANYTGAPWSGNDDDTAAAVTAFFNKHDLTPAPSYFSGQFWNPEVHDAIIESATKVAKISQDLGLTELFVADGGFFDITRSGLPRRDTVTHVRPEDSLTDDQFRQMTSTVQHVAEATLEHGVRSIFHNHAGTFVETHEEIERLLDGTDPEVLFLGPDTGHLTWAGIDAADFVRRHASRVKGLHLKDVNLDVRAEGVAGGWGYDAYEAAGLWTEVGQGDVDFPSILSSLNAAGFDGWLIVETDKTQLASPLESAIASREYLRGLGL